MLSLNCWLGHSSHCNSYNLQQKVLNSCDFLFNDKASKNIHDNLLLDINNFKTKNG